MIDWKTIARNQTDRKARGWREGASTCENATNRVASATPKVAPVLRPDRFKNKWERDYATTQLEVQKHMGLILDWRYEALSFRLADATHLHPDFLVITKTGFEIHEVKGLAREKWWARFKIAVEMYPWFRWFVCERQKGEWETKEVGK